MRKVKKAKAIDVLISVHALCDGRFLIESNYGFSQKTIITRKELAAGAEYLHRLAGDFERELTLAKKRAR